MRYETPYFTATMPKPGKLLPVARGRVTPKRRTVDANSHTGRYLLNLMSANDVKTFEEECGPFGILGLGAFRK